MNLLATLIRAEWLQLRREPAAWALLGSVWLVMLLALASGTSFTRSQQLSLAEVQRKEAEALQRAKAARPRSAGDTTGFAYYYDPTDLRGYAFNLHEAYAVKLPAPLSALAIGDADLLPAYQRVRADALPAEGEGYEHEHPLRLALGRFDLVFVVLWVMPLALLALVHPVLSVERQSRRLALMQLHAGGGARLMARVLAAGLLVRGLLPMAGLLALTALAALVSQAVPLAAALSLLGWMGMALAYLMFWLLVAAAVCVRASDPATAAFRLFAVWVVVAIVLPALTATLTRALAPTPSREAFVAQLRDAVDAVTRERLRHIEAFYNDHPELRPPNTPIAKLGWTSTYLIRQRALGKAQAPALAHFQDALNRQRRVHRQLSWASPLTLARRALVEASGNGLRRHEDFVRRANAHQAALAAWFLPRVSSAARREDETGCKGCAALYRFDDFDAVPRFEPR